MYTARMQSTCAAMVPQKGLGIVDVGILKHVSMYVERIFEVCMYICMYVCM